MEEGERSIIEVKHLLHKLNPRGPGGHKDRVRVLSRFRNYVSGVNANKKGQKISTPEFYDDDLPLLFLGSDSPDSLYDADQYGDLSNYYGLLKACATPSTDRHEGGLKRSARNAMTLLKYLVCDHVDLKDGEPVNNGIDLRTGLPELNLFAYALCSLSASQLQLANFDAHLLDYSGKDGAVRSGAKEDACEVLVLLFTRHFDSNDTGRNQGLGSKLRIADILTKSEARYAFESWMIQNVSKDVQNAILKKDNQTQKQMVPTQISPTKPIGSGKESSINPFEEDAEVDLDAAFKSGTSKASADRQQRLDKIGIHLDVVGRKDADTGNPPSKWEDSALAKKQVRLSLEEEAASETAGVDGKWSKQIEERQKMIGRDPLGIRPENFDLRSIKDKVVNLLTETIEDLNEEIEEMGDNGKKEESKRKKKDKYAYSVEQLISLEAQKAKLEAILFGNPDGYEGDGQGKRSAAELSILPSDANFDPLLFLTIVHGNASYEQLKESADNLENKTDDQTQRIQQLIRENFELFIKCADGIDLFRTGRAKKNSPGVYDWLSRLESLAQSTEKNAKKSFKPLLDNTNEVRKVQSALAVLQRVGPLLQVPSLMRQHIENGRFSAAVSTYRRALVIDDKNKIKLLHHVKQKAAEAARDARVDLEKRLANPTLPVHAILDSIKSLTELNELDIPVKEMNSDEEKNEETELEQSEIQNGIHTVKDMRVDIRAHPPSLSCLLLQAAHFQHLVEEEVEKTESIAQRIYNGEPLLSVATENDDYTADEISLAKSVDSKTSDKRERIRWKYDVLESRVIATIRVVALAQAWLPRLLRIAEAARQSEMRLAARTMRKRPKGNELSHEINITAFEVFITHISPAITLLVEHGAFVALGSNERHNTVITYGKNDVNERLQKLIVSPLPAAQSSKCATELAHLAEVVQIVAKSAIGLRPSEKDDGFGPDQVSKASHYQRAAMEASLEKIISLMEETVVEIERRKCIYSFDQCNRACSMRASGSGIFDVDSIISCVQTLSDELTRPKKCSEEIEKGCELVVRRCCEGLANYVRDRGDSACLRAVSECAAALNESISHLIREVSDLTNHGCPLLEEVLIEDVMTLENRMFDEFLTSIARHMSTYTRLGPMNVYEEEDEFIAEKMKAEEKFPSHLSASLLAIVRCRAQVERTLGIDTVRKHQVPSATYQYLAMSTAADSVVEGICSEIGNRMSRMRGSQADQYLSELQFLMTTLKKYLGDDALNTAENCKNKLLAKIGGVGGSHGQGPDGLGAIERLERLGRIYVMCLIE